MTLAASRSTRRHLSRLCPDRGNPEVKVENRTYQYLYDPTAADNFRFADDPETISWLNQNAEYGHVQRHIQVVLEGCSL